MVLLSKNFPLVSVLMPVYNSEGYVKAAIKSILNQTYRNIELIIIDDASTDSTCNIISSFSDKRIRYIKNNKRLDISKSLNKALLLSNGDFIARMDGDDIACMDRFERQVDFFRNNEDIDICGGWIELFGASNGIKKYPLNHDEIKIELIFNNSIAHPTVMFRRTVYEKYRDFYFYNENIARAQDFELWSRLIHEFKFANIGEVLLKYRVHRKQIGKIYSEEYSASIRKIIYNNLCKLNYGTKEAETDYFYNKYFDIKGVNSLSDCLRLYIICFKIIQLNYKSKVYNEHLLSKNLGSVCFSICKRNTKFFINNKILNKLFLKLCRIYGLFR